MSLILSAITGDVSDFDARRVKAGFFTHFDHMFQPAAVAVSGWESYRPENVEYHAVAVLRQHGDDGWEHGILVWRTNYLCCHRCGPTLGCVENVTIELLLSDIGPADVGWSPATSPREFSEAELLAAIFEQQESCSKVSRWCRGNEHS